VRRRRLDSRLVRGVLSLGLVLGVGATGTYALWTDAVPITGTTISSGTIDLTVNGSDTTVSFTSMNITTMVPGNSVAGVLTVRNGGTAPLRYYVDAAASSALGPALTIKVTNDSAVTGTAPSATCAGTSIATPTFSNTTANFLGSSASPRLLNVGQSETLCIQATLPTNATSTLQGLTSNIGFNVNGTSF
jgi:predicted ribosomally synthesized peptide with SipW-like signal peptide